LAKCFHKEKIHTALETCGYFDPQTDNGFLADIDLVLFDIKLYDDAFHKKFCGTSNTKIKENFTRLAAQSLARTGPAIWPRLPLIPTITDTEENLTAWTQFLKRTGIRYLTLVPYHNLGNSKRDWLNLPPAPEFSALTDDRRQASIDLLEQHGFSCFLPGEEDWAQAGYRAERNQG
jgi:pyruvate formate lyase activating enzyme